MANPTSISTVSEADLPILSDFLYSSKLSLTINRLLITDWPNEEYQRKNYSAAMEGAFADPASECLKAVDEVTGDTLGFVVLKRAHPSTSEASSNDGDNATKPIVPGGMNPDVLCKVGEAVAYLGRETDNIERFDITFIYVVPSSRRKGIGSQLLQQCRDRAAAAGLPLTAVTEPEAYEFHMKAGPTETGHFDIDLAKLATSYSGFGLFRLTSLIWPA